MKSKLSRGLLESALSRCYDAGEKKATESITKLSFEGAQLNLYSKGSFTFYEETIPVIESNATCDFCIKTSTLFEFVKYISSDDLYMIYDEEKKTCMVSTPDKKSKLALQLSDVEIEPGQQQTHDTKFAVENPHELLSKLNYASKFCSLNFQDHPLTGIHLYVEQDKLSIKATNGPIFYSDTIAIDSDNISEIYLPKKAPQILKNIFSEHALKKCSISSKTVLFESDKCKLTLYIENCSKDSFPAQILNYLKTDSVASVKVSSFEITKTLKFFHGVFGDTPVNFNVKNDVLNLESKENSLAAKEAVVVESVNGESSSAYNSKSFLDCLESLNSHWVNIEFVPLQGDFNICKLTNDKTLILLCPTTF